MTLNAECALWSPFDKAVNVERTLAKQNTSHGQKPIEHLLLIGVPTAGGSGVVTEKFWGGGMLVELENDAIEREFRRIGGLTNAPLTDEPGKKWSCETGFGTTHYANRQLSVADPFSTWTTLVDPINRDPVAAYRASRTVLSQTRGALNMGIRRQLDVLSARYRKQAPKAVLGELIEQMGVGQLTTARAVGVTSTAIRKWRRGEHARPEHRDRLAQFAALCRVLNDAEVHDFGGWLDIPISRETDLTPLDLHLNGRTELAVMLGQDLADPHEVLETLDPDLRARLEVDDEYEVIVMEDGTRSAVPRRAPVGR